MPAAEESIQPQVAAEEPSSTGDKPVDSTPSTTEKEGKAGSGDVSDVPDADIVPTSQGTEQPPSSDSKGNKGQDDATSNSNTVGDSQDTGPSDSAVPANNDQSTDPALAASTQDPAPSIPAAQANTTTAQEGTSKSPEDASKENEERMRRNLDSLQNADRMRKNLASLENEERMRSNLQRLQNEGNDNSSGDITATTTTTTTTTAAAGDTAPVAGNGGGQAEDGEQSTPAPTTSGTAGTETGEGADKTTSTDTAAPESTPASDSAPATEGTGGDGDPGKAEQPPDTAAEAAVEGQGEREGGGEGDQATSADTAQEGTDTATPALEPQTETTAAIAAPAPAESVPKAPVSIAVVVRPFDKSEKDKLTGSKKQVWSVSGTTTVYAEHTSSTTAGVSLNDKFEADFATMVAEPSMDNVTIAQDNVWNTIGEPAARSTWDGYDNCIVFYGAARTGKTFAAHGDDRQDGPKPKTGHPKQPMLGVIPRSIDAFLDLSVNSRTEQGDAGRTSGKGSGSGSGGGKDKLSPAGGRKRTTSKQGSSAPGAATTATPSAATTTTNASPGAHHASDSIEVSIIEIYHEQLHDCLAEPPSKDKDKEKEGQSGCELAQVTDTAYEVVGRHWVTITTREEYCKLHELVMRDRLRRINNGNLTADAMTVLTSIRVLRYTSSHDAPEKDIRLSQLDFFDLAAAGPTLSRVADRASMDIYRGIHAVDNVLAALAKEADLAARPPRSYAVGKDPHLSYVPFDQSVVTRLMQHSFLGPVRTSFVVTFSPSKYSVPQSAHVFKCLHRIKALSTKPSRNESTSFDEAIRQLEAMVAHHKEIASSTHVSVTEAHVAKVAGRMATSNINRLKSTGKERRRKLQALIESMETSLKTLPVVLIGERGHAGGRSEAFEDPYLVCLCADQSLSSRYAIPLLIGTVAFGTPAIAKNRVQIDGVYIAPQHCTIKNKGGVCVLSPEQGSMVYAQGVRVFSNVQLSANHRIILGNNHFFVYKDPKDGSATGRELTDYQSLLGEMKTKTMAAWKLEHTKDAQAPNAPSEIQAALTSVLPLVAECAAISVALDRTLQVEPQLLTVESGGATDLNILLTHTESKRTHNWTPAQLEARTPILRHYYHTCMREGFDDFPLSLDPFYDPPEPVLVGTAKMSMESLLYYIESEIPGLPIRNPGDTAQVGSVSVSLHPVLPAGVTDDGDDQVEVGERFELLIQILTISDLPDHLRGDVHCKFKFFGDARKEYVSTVIPGKHQSVDVMFETAIVIDSVTEEFTQFLKHKQLAIEIWAVPDDPGPYVGPRSGRRAIAGPVSSLAVPGESRLTRGKSVGAMSDTGSEGSKPVSRSGSTVALSVGKSASKADLASDARKHRLFLGKLKASVEQLAFYLPIDIHDIAVQDSVGLSNGTVSIAITPCNPDGSENDFDDSDEIDPAQPYAFRISIPKFTLSLPLTPASPPGILISFTLGGQQFELVAEEPKPLTKKCRKVTGACQSIVVCYSDPRPLCHELTNDLPIQASVYALITLPPDDEVGSSAPTESYLASLMEASKDEDLSDDELIDEDQDKGTEDTAKANVTPAADATPTPAAVAVTESGQGEQASASAPGPSKKKRQGMDISEPHFTDRKEEYMGRVVLPVKSLLDLATISKKKAAVRLHGKQVGHASVAIYPVDEQGVAIDEDADLDVDEIVAGEQATRLQVDIERVTLQDDVTRGQEGRTGPLLIVASVCDQVLLCREVEVGEEKLEFETLPRLVHHRQLLTIQPTTEDVIDSLRIEPLIIELYVYTAGESPELTPCEWATQTVAGLADKPPPEPTPEPEPPIVDPTPLPTTTEGDPEGTKTPAEAEEGDRDSDNKDGESKAEEEKKEEEEEKKKEEEEKEEEKKEEEEEVVEQEEEKEEAAAAPPPKKKSKACAIL